MNICLVSRELYPFQKAGIGVYIYNLTKSFNMNGHNVYIITSKENEMEHIRRLDNNTNVTVIGVDLGEEALLFEDFNYAYSYGVYNKLKQLVNHYEIDLIEFADFFGEAFFSILYKKVRGEFAHIPFVVKLHTPTYECNLANQIEEPETNLTLQEDYTIINVDYVCAISYFMKDTIANRLQRSDIHVIYNMIDNPDINSSEINVKQILHKNYVLYVGRLEERKGIDLFVKAAIKYLENHKNDIYFVVIGQDVLNLRSNKMVKDELIELIPKDLHDNFVWKMPMLQEDLFHYYRHAYVSVFPSRFEGFGNVCVEAMTMGSPVIVSNNTAMMEIIDVDDNYGISFSNDDYFDLYIKLTELLNDEQQRNHLSSLSKQRAEDFALSNIYPAQIQYYKSVIEQYKAGDVKRQEDILEHILLKNVDRVQYFIKENKRLTEEWSHLAKINEQRNDDINKFSEENKRILGEWEYSTKINEELNKQIYNLNLENQRILNEWEIMVSKHSKILAQLEEQDREIKNLFALTEDGKGKLEQKTIELKEVTELLQNKKFLVKQLITGKRGKKT
ncbi:glycosyltransferase family 4 protein [Paenibacillus sp. V4I5]|uniref:glycosyltransferase family 4 protein n=1 Tax=Paenibacillus sp. V4I5 TaxID=3042306 RepID=UPI002791A446|nr:glycosyltransferase family 4 protein [Paenibacillus sp. V4I5]MDQ0917614.1 glycosyltransferase involved in cell wall biosynthesis [Paenibacillus sp. V4I5]